MARRLGKEPIKRRRPTKGKPVANRRHLGTDTFSERVRDAQLLTPDGFHKRTGIDLRQALIDLGPSIRNQALDDSKAELLVAWGRCAEKRLGMALFIEDVIRAMTPADCKQWRENICQCALGVWHNPEEQV